MEDRLSLCGHLLGEYSPAYADVDARRARLRSQLMNRGGGPLGVVAVKEPVRRTAHNRPQA
jgi:hypothetical protein